jgi:hypothetical protein
MRLKLVITPLSAALMLLLAACGGLWRRKSGG